MKSHVFHSAFCILLFAFCTLYSLPAFPGAQGWGKDSRGGRSGVVINNRTYNTRVVHVTNLNPSGAGSLAAAVVAGGPRVIVFDTSGVINMNNANMTIHSYCYVAGQTSPGGIIIIGGGIFAPPAVTDATMFTDNWNCTEDVIIRFIRNRASRYWGGDDNFRCEGCKDVIIDHCSFGNCCDEVVDVMYAYNMTFSNCVISESNVQCGGEVNYHAYLAAMSLRHSLINCFFVHHSSRVPLLDNCYYGTGCTPLTGPNEIVNTVVYDCSPSQSFQAENTASFNLVGNYVKAGPSYNYAFAWAASGSQMQVHLEGNYDPGNPSRTQNSFITNGPAYSASMIQPVNFSGQTSGQQAVTDMVAQCGALPRDSCDARLVREMQTGTGKWRVLTSTELNTQRLIPRDPLNLPKWQKPLDTDNDAMPDYWETAHGLNPNDPADVATAMNGGYDAIEVYVNELADTLIEKGRWPIPMSIEEARLFHAGYSLTARPNPARGFARFGLNLPSRHRVTLDVFDVRGARVARVLDKTMDAGGHTVDWRAGGLGAGIYFARVNMGPYHSQKQLLILN